MEESCKMYVWTALGSFSNNVQLYSLNYKIAFLSHFSWGIGDKINAFQNILTQRNFVAKFYRENVSFIRKTAK